MLCKSFIFLSIFCFVIIISGCSSSSPTACFIDLNFDFVVEVKVEENISFTLRVDDHEPIQSNKETDWAAIAFFSKQPSIIRIQASKLENATENDGIVIRVTNNSCESVPMEEFGAHTSFASYTPAEVGTYTDGDITLPRYWVLGEKTLLFGFELRVRPVRPQGYN